MVLGSGKVRGGADPADQEIEASMREKIIYIIKEIVGGIILGVFLIAVVLIGLRLQVR
ncbi:MAG: hypothetical protein J6C37_06055 [Roseburia sp.]|nr:hypothetical protein [Roseburia sp.]